MRFGLLTWMVCSDQFTRFSNRRRHAGYRGVALVNGSNAHRNCKGELQGLRRITVPAKSAGAVIAYALATPVCLLLGSHVLMNCLVRGGHHLSRLSAMMGIELVKKRDF